MTRTLENCTFIQKAVKKGIGTPERYHNKCMGYQKSEDDDEPCEICKRCRLSVYNEKQFENISCDNYSDDAEIPTLACQVDD